MKPPHMRPSHPPTRPPTDAPAPAPRRHSPGIRDSGAATPWAAGSEVPNRPGFAAGFGPRKDRPHREGRATDDHATPQADNRPRARAPPTPRAPRGHPPGDRHQVRSGQARLVSRTPRPGAAALEWTYQANFSSNSLAWLHPHASWSLRQIQSGTERATVVNRVSWTRNP